MRGRTYYNILGIKRAATLSDIKRAYRRLALRYHPDRTHNEANATEKFKEINEAYEVLSHPSQRKQYDASGSASEVHAEQNFRNYACPDCGTYTYAKASWEFYNYNYHNVSSSSSKPRSSSSSSKASKAPNKHSQGPTKKRHEPYTYHYNSSFVIYIAGRQCHDTVSSSQCGFAWAIYECDANGNSTDDANDIIHQGKGSFCNTSSPNEAAYRGLFDAVQYFRQYLVCESYYVRCDSSRVIDNLQKEMEEWNGLFEEETDSENSTDGGCDYHQRSIQNMRKISSSWRRFEAVAPSQNRAAQHAKDALGSRSM